MLLDFEQPDQQALLDALLAGLSKKSDSDFDNESINPVCNMSFSILYNGMLQQCWWVVPVCNNEAFHTPCWRLACFRNVVGLFV